MLTWAIVYAIIHANVGHAYLVISIGGDVFLGLCLVALVSKVLEQRKR